MFGIRTAGYITNLLFFFVLAANADAQDCKRLLEEINRRPEFPTGRLNDCISCLTSLDSEHKRLVGVEPKNRSLIADITGTLLERNKTVLNQARAANDSVRIDKFIKKETELRAKLDSLTLDIANSREQARSLKNLLKDSYGKVIAHFTEIDDSRKTDFQRKLDALTRED